MEAKQNISQEQDMADGNRAVMRRFSVSLVFQREAQSRLMTALMVRHVDATSEAEALGECIHEVWSSEELKDYQLALKVVMPFSAA